jgi:hypothetical protein
MGVQFQEGMLAHQNEAEDLVAADEMPWKKNVLRPIITDNVGKWKKGLSAKQIMLIEGACREPFESGCYEYSTHRGYFLRYASRGVVSSLVFLAKARRLARRLGRLHE